MADYRDHRGTSLGWWLVVSLLVYLVKDRVGLGDAGALTAVAAGLPAALLGAGFPDIDLAGSIPHRRFRLALFVVVSLLALRPLLSDQVTRALEAALAETGLSPALAATAGVVLALLLGALAVALLAFFLPRHRGITHRWPLALVVAVGLGVLVRASLPLLDVATPTATQAAVAVGGYFALGFASHLFRDGMLFARSRRR